MIIDHRVYRALPGRLPAQLELYGKLGYPVQLRYMGEPLCYAVVETGELNTFMHIWVYENAADREDKRARMAADPDWKTLVHDAVSTAPRFRLGTSRRSSTRHSGTNRAHNTQ